MWPLNIKLRPPPEPSQMPTTLGRSSSTSCQVTDRPMSSNRSRTCSAIACSLPVGLGTSTSPQAVSTRRRSSTRASSSELEVSIAMELT
jgi:hypothetical protein